MFKARAGEECLESPADVVAEVSRKNSGDLCRPTKSGGSCTEDSTNG